MDREELSIASVGIVNKSFSLIAKFGKLTPKLHNYYIIYIWRAERDRLPRRINLDSLGIELHSLLCPMCDTECESLEHVLVSCQCVAKGIFVVEVWYGFESLFERYNLLCSESLFS